MPPTATAPAAPAPDVLVIGAGVAGLACATALQRRGARVAVVDKARGVGGRCATRRVDGRPVDHGVAFLHGASTDFLAALEAVPVRPGERRLDGWPYRVTGDGPPCQPTSLDPGTRRLAFSEGVSAFPKSLAAQLTHPVRLATRVTALSLVGPRLEAHLEGDAALAAPTVVLALPCEQAVALLAGLDDVAPALPSIRALLGATRSQACLTVLAGYDAATPRPDFDLFHPPLDSPLGVVAFDSNKRAADAPPVFVLQARPAWSHRHLETDPAVWTAALLAEAARRLGPWAASPAWSQSHRWRFARVDAAFALAAPLSLELAAGVRLVLTGEAFGARTGVEGAWVAGISAAAAAAK